MLKIIFSCVLTGVVSIIVSYIINILLGNRRAKNELIYKQLTDYSVHLSLLAEKWTEFDDLMKYWHTDQNESIAPVVWQKSLTQMQDIKKCYAAYSASVHQTGKIISTNFNDGDKFYESVYSKSAEKNDSYAEATFFARQQNDFQLYNKGQADLPDEGKANQAMNGIYGTYLQIYKYRVQTKLAKAQAYIDEKLQSVMDNISTHKLDKRQNIL